MGCSAGDNSCSPDERPVHSVRITKEFEIGKYEVTQAQWQFVMGFNPSRLKQDNRPVENVSWTQAQEFLNRLNAQNDGYRYRLPTEAEWEYAARAGSSGPFAGNVDDVAWYINNSGRTALKDGALDAADPATWLRTVTDNENQNVTVVSGIRLEPIPALDARTNTAMDRDPVGGCRRCRWRSWLLRRRNTGKKHA